MDTIHRITTNAEQTHIISAGPCAVVVIAEARSIAGDDFVTCKATPALVEQVQTEGGAIAWDCLPDGTHCTVEEAEAATA